jgi:hypothetical protein
MWKNLYDSFLQSMTVSWAQFMQVNHSPGRIVRDNFQNKIYPEIGLYLIVLTVIFSVFYYYYLNSRFGRYYSLGSWFFLLGLCSIAVWLTTWLRARSILEDPIIDVSSQLLWIGIINAIYAAVLFVLLALLLKWGSPMGKRTPF